MALNYTQDGSTLMLAPGAAVAAGAGYLFGPALFGVAQADIDSGVTGPFKTEGVFELPKTSALAIAVGDALYWDAAAKVVNKTTAGNKCIGAAVSAAGNPSATVQVKLGAFVLAGT